MTSYGGPTTYGSAAPAGPVGGRTPAWSSSARTPYGVDHGFTASASTNIASGFDAFAAGSHTPAYGIAGSSATHFSSSSRTPAWQGAASAPTPAARAYDAPTPAASAPTPGVGYGDDDAYTPAPYLGAPTPGAGPINAPTPAALPSFAKGANKEPLKTSRFDAPTPAATAATPYTGGYDAPTPAAGTGPRYVDDDSE